LIELPALVQPQLLGLSPLILDLQFTIVLARETQTNILLIYLFVELVIQLLPTLIFGILYEHWWDICFDCAVLAEGKTADAAVVSPLEEAKVFGAASIRARLGFLVGNPMVFIFIQ
jgi:hypothetical protein